MEIVEIAYCEVYLEFSDNFHYSMGDHELFCKVCSNSINIYIKESDHKSKIAAKNSEIEAKNSEIAAKNSEIQNLKNNFAGQLHDEKEFVDVKIVCNEKTFDGHKAVLSCRSEVFKTIIRNKSLTEKQAAVMEINENDFNYETMEQVLFYFYHGNVKDDEMIDTDLLRAADKYEVVGLLHICAEYLESNLDFDNALDVLVAAELTNQKALFESAATFVRENPGKMNKTGAYKEMREKDTKFIAIVMDKVFDIE